VSSRPKGSYRTKDAKLSRTSKTDFAGLTDRPDRDATQWVALSALSGPPYSKFFRQATSSERSGLSGEGRVI